MISTHILDTSKGVPAAGVPVRLQIRSNSTWKDIEVGSTNSDGRHSFDCETLAGTYQIIFEVEAYLKSAHKESFFAHIPVVFKIEHAQKKYHVPLLLNPFGYSTYRGS
jgi:5-hydroxyisourate hydrolase